MDRSLRDVSEEQINSVTRTISPEESDIELATWLRENKADVEHTLCRTPALLFRGFKNVTARNLSDLSAVFSEPISYVYRSTPRTELTKGVYTATEYPSESTIPQHCENAYQNRWPLKLYFHCEKSADEGGETPLSDMRKVTEDIPEEIRDKFKQKKVMYVRNYSPGLDIPWQTVFQTEDRNAVELYCRNNSIDWEWIGTDALRTKQICQSVATHPVTKEEIWFNQAHLFHFSNLEPELRDFLLGMYSEDALPRNAYYGDGEPIAEHDLKAIRNAFETHKHTFSWKDNDTLLVDNMLCAHGRNPFSGSRKVLVTMTSPVSV